MNVPLMIIAIDQELIVYRNKKPEKVPFPFKPFVLVEKSKFPTQQGNLEQWTKVPEGDVRDYLKLNFDTTKDVQNYVAVNEANKKYIYYNGYVEQLLITQPDFITNYPTTEPIEVMFWDIETKTVGDGRFPIAAKQPILCIGYSIWEYFPDGSKKKKSQKVINTYRDTKEQDIAILIEFIDDIKKLDPDIIAGYNCTEFDFPYLFERCKIKKVPINIGRNGKEPSFGRNGDVFINGRVHYDIFNKVKKDQTLFGIKSKSLKDLARHYKCKFDDVELKGDVENTFRIWKEDRARLIKYQESDIYRTEHVGNVYLRNDITLAERVKVPLGLTLNSYASFIPKIFMARNMWERKQVNTENNYSKYNLIDGSICKLKPIDEKYEGAIVGLYKRGYFNRIWKVDFSSQYPSSVCTFNLGPDTTSFVELKPFTGKFSFDRDEKFNWYRIPDKNFNVDIVIKVRNDVQGFLKEEIKGLWAERKKIKAEIAALPKGDPRFEALNSQQLAIKVILNSIYGVFGLKSTLYGDMMSAVMVTGMCRWTTTMTMNHPKIKNNVIETDSVTGDTPIYVYNIETNEIDIIPIEDLHQSNNKRKNYTGKYLVLTRNGWKKVKYTKKHKVNKNIHRVKISDGYVDVTEDHSLFNSNKKEITPKEIIPKKSVIETVKKNPKSKACLIYRATLSDPDFCWLIGFLIAEGSVYEGYTKSGKEKRQVSFNGNSLKLMKKVEKLANEHFAWLKLNGLPKKPHTFKLHNTLKSSAVYKIQGGYNKDICNFLKETCYTKNRKDKKVPAFILNGTVEMKKAFLDGIMIGDGHIAIYSDNRKVESLDSKFKSLSAGIRYLWNSLGYETTCNIRKDKLNITTYKKQFSYNNGTLKKINRNIVTKNDIISNNKELDVYDISTEDGTFVTALGNIVLHNTDGLIIDKNIDENEINKYLDKIILDTFNIKENFLRLEKESKYQDAFFCKMKTYVVRKGEGYEIHGSALKSSRLPPIVDRAIRLAIDHIFNSKPLEEVIHEAHSFVGSKLEDFIYRVKLSKDKALYKDDKQLALFLSKQEEKLTGQICEEGMQFQYVVTNKQLPDPEFAMFYDKKTRCSNYTHIGFVKSVDEIDKKYYIEMIDKALLRFNLKPVEQLNLFNKDDFEPTPYPEV